MVRRDAQEDETQAYLHKQNLWMFGFFPLRVSL